MNKSIVKRSLFFLAIFASIQIPIAAMGQPAARSNYQAINAKQFLADRKITLSNPKDIAAKLFSSDRESEGRKSDQISVEYPTRETAVIVHTVIGLADDSVAAMRTASNSDSGKISGKLSGLADNPSVNQIADTKIGQAASVGRAE
jgi:hypothetical protein